MADQLQVRKIRFLDAAVSARGWGPDEKKPVLRGIIDPKSLALLQTASYRREILIGKTVEDLVEPVTLGNVADVLLGARDPVQYDVVANGAIEVTAVIVIIDGGQRYAAARWVQQTNPQQNVCLGAKLLFGTDEAIECDLYTKANTLGLRLSPSVLLQGFAGNIPVVRAIMHLTNEEGFPLQARVGWGQRLDKGQLINGRTVMAAIGGLHSRFGPTKGKKPEDLAKGLQRVAELITPEQLIENGRTLFALLETCFKISSLTENSRESPQLKGGFLNVFVKMLCERDEVWTAPARGQRRVRLVVPNRIVEKLCGFNVYHSEVVKLASGGATTEGLLLDKLVKHLRTYQPEDKGDDQSLEEDPSQQDA